MAGWAAWSSAYFFRQAIFAGTFVVQQALSLEEVLRHDEETGAAGRASILFPDGFLDIIQVGPFPDERCPVDVVVFLRLAEFIFVPCAQGIDALVHFFQPALQAHEVMRLKARVAVVEAANENDDGQVHEVNIHVERFRGQKFLLDPLVAHVERGVDGQGNQIDGIGIVDDGALHASGKELGKAADVFITV